jgi:hypothetical protein
VHYVYLPTWGHGLDLPLLLGTICRVYHIADMRFLCGWWLGAADSAAAASASKVPSMRASQRLQLQAVAMNVCHDDKAEGSVEQKKSGVDITAWQELLPTPVAVCGLQCLFAVGVRMPVGLRVVQCSRSMTA